MLCALASAVFAASFASLPRGFSQSSSIAAAIALFALTTRVLSNATMDASWTGGLVAAAAGWQILYPRHGIVALGVAGSLAAAWATLLAAAGISRIVALPVAAGVPIVTAMLASRNRGFAPAILREEALLLILFFAVIVSMGPTILRGWQSALALNTIDERAALTMVPVWTVSFVVLSMTAGGLWALWRRG
jgi:hypothetical protein